MKTVNKRFLLVLLLCGILIGVHYMQKAGNSSSQTEEELILEDLCGDCAKYCKGNE